MQISELFEQTHKLPNIPKVVQELIDTFNQEDVDMEVIAEKIAMDPVLTAKVLRLANSAHYGVSKTVATTQDASVLLGFATLRTLVLASGITGALQTPDGFDRKLFWRNNFAVAAIAKWMANYTKINPETAFTAGMLHSIGELLILLLLPSEAKKIDAAVSAGGRLHQVEKSMLGFDYAEVGGELAARWKFPEDIIKGIACHTNPMETEEFSALGGLIYLAVYVHDCHIEGSSDEEILERFPTNVAKAVGMDLDQALEDLKQTEGIESGMDSLLDD